ncbi:hypothetical protein Cni_G28147 [Canna indica]|uniref:Uncharacterized protein n=1 Tax=Canna indica TaxID=4628 RepID=A0AAQ3QQ14_9LILI|nr:hypothetical protein Cni_G28147 [Canna indica]
MWRGGGGAHVISRSGLRGALNASSAMAASVTRLGLTIGHIACESIASSVGRRGTGATPSGEAEGWEITRGYVLSLQTMHIIASKSMTPYDKFFSSSDLTVMDYHCLNCQQNKPRVTCFATFLACEFDIIDIANL